MDIRQLNYFISVADNLSFTKAALEQHIAQTAISQQISSLEKELEVQLFIRNNRSVRLTNAGCVLLKEAKEIIKKVEEAEEKTRQASIGFNGSLKIGTLGPCEKKFLPELLREFHEIYPNVVLNIDKDNYKRLMEKLKDGFLDIIFTYPDEIKNIENIYYKTLYKDHICLVTYKDHPLAKKKVVTPDMIKNENFIDFDLREAPETMRVMRNNCKKDGINLNVVAKSRFLETMLELVEAKVGIALVPSCIKDLYNTNLSFIEIDSCNQYTELAVAYLESNMNPHLKPFMKIVENINLKR